MMAIAKSYTVVRWSGVLSVPKLLMSGVRQGSILSPALFAVYLIDLLINLKNSNYGCYIKHIGFNVFMHADDLLLFALSSHELQEMINICEKQFVT